MEGLRNCVVYKHTNKINGKCYIGIVISNRNPQSRWGINGKNYLNNAQPKFANAIKKYGWNNFNHEILFTNLTKEEAKIKEKKLIQKYDSFKNGYNATLGGDGHNGLKHSFETKEKIRKLHLGTQMSQEAKQRMSESQIAFRKKLTEEERKTLYGLKGNKNGMYGVHRFKEQNPFYGKKHSQETKDKISKANYRRVSSKRKKVLQFRLNGKLIKEWNSITEAAKYLKKESSHISQCCNLKRNNAYGFIWRFKNGTN